VLGRPKRLLESAALPPLRLPYSQGGIQVGNLLFLRGFTAQDRHGELIGPGDMRAQTEQTFANMAIVLAEAGGTLADLMQTHVTITDWHDYSDDNEVYNRHVREPFPTRTTVQGAWDARGC
jgi:2-iminobutanoate/2-iminopropanoate deaminase